jgi:hypothetical protein
MCDSENVNDIDLYNLSGKAEDYDLVLKNIDGNIYDEIDYDNKDSRLNKIGSFKVGCLDLDLADDLGLNALDVCDSHTQASCDLYMNTFNDDGELAEIDGEDVIHCRRILYIYEIIVDKKYRGKKLSWAIVSYLIKKYNSDVVFLKPAPAEGNNKKTFNSAVKKLKKHWMGYGFKRISTSKDYLGLDLSYAQPQYFWVDGKIKKG